MGEPFCIEDGRENVEELKKYSLSAHILFSSLLQNIAIKFLH